MVEDSVKQLHGSLEVFIAFSGKTDTEGENAGRAFQRW
jgi:hypothetical protein